MARRVCSRIPPPAGSAMTVPSTPASDTAGFGALPPNSDLRWYARAETGTVNVIMGTTFLTEDV